MSRMLKNIGLFCKRALQKRPVFCKETCIFKHPTHRSHPIVVRNGYFFLVRSDGLNHFRAPRRRVVFCSQRVIFLGPSPYKLWRTSIGARRLRGAVHIVVCRYNAFPDFHFIQFVGAFIHAIPDSNF